MARTPQWPNVGRGPRQRERDDGAYRYEPTTDRFANHPTLVPVPYYCEAPSIIGFVQQLAVHYMANGYWHYVTATIPETKDPRKIDTTIVEKYCVAVSKYARCRRRQAVDGLGRPRPKNNMQYLRYGRFFVILSTDGEDDRRVRFGKTEANSMRDARVTPIQFGGYSISSRSGHACVRIERERFKELRAYFAEFAARRPRDWLEQEVRRLPFEPWKPIQWQLEDLVDEINDRRKRVGLKERVRKTKCIRRKRRLVKPFEADPDVPVLDEVAA